MQEFRSGYVYVCLVSYSCHSFIQRSRDRNRFCLFFRYSRKLLVTGAGVRRVGKARFDVQEKMKIGFYLEGL